MVYVTNSVFCKYFAENPLFHFSVRSEGDILGMQLYFCYSLIALICYLAIWRPVFLKKKFPMISLAICVVLLGVVGWQEIRWQNVQSKGSVAVREVSQNKDGYLRCQRLSEALFDIHTSRLGSVSSAEPNRAVVNYEECLEIMGWLESDKKSATPVQVQAIHVLTHEAVHVSGEYNESVTECTAINRDHITAKTLGGSKAFIDEMPQRYFTEYFPRMSSSYRLPGCLLSEEFDSILLKQRQETHKNP